MKREESEKHKATLRLKQQDAIIEEQPNQIAMEWKQEIKFKIDHQEQEYRLEMEKKRLKWTD